MVEATSELGVTRQTVLQRVKRGEPPTPVLVLLRPQKRLENQSLG